MWIIAAVFMFWGWTGVGETGHESALGQRGRW